MHRLKGNPQFGKNLSEWKNHNWIVTIAVNARQVVTGVRVDCKRRLDDGTEADGNASRAIAPFDDLRSMIGALIIESAIAAAGPGQEWVDIPLDFGTN